MRAVRDESGTWHGDPRFLPAGAYNEASTFIAFSPVDRYNPLAGQVLTVRFGNMEFDDHLSLYTLPVRLGDGSQLNLRMTNAVMDALFGSADTGSPEYKKWQAARERRIRESGTE